MKSSATRKQLGEDQKLKSCGARRSKKAKLLQSAESCRRASNWVHCRVRRKMERILLVFTFRLRLRIRGIRSACIRSPCHLPNDRKVRDRCKWCRNWCPSAGCNEGSTASHNRPERRRKNTGHEGRTEHEDGGSERRPEHSSRNSTSRKKETSVSLSQYPSKVT